MANGEEQAPGMFGLEYIINREGLGYSIKGKLDEENSETLKTVIRQHWKEKLETLDKSKSKHVAAEIESHLSNMHSIIDPIDYEAFCVPNIIQHSKHMPKEDFAAYLRIIESMAVGYSEHLGKDLTNLILIGVTAKGRSVPSAERYLAMLLNDVSKRANYYQIHINKRNKSVYALAGRLRAHNSSILRIFKGRKIAVLTKKIHSKNKEIDILKGRLDKCNYTLSRIQTTRSRKTFAPAAAISPRPPGRD